MSFLDVFTATWCRIWYRLDDDLSGDLDLARCAPHAVGSPPEWILDAWSNAGHESTFQLGWRPHPVDGYNVAWSEFAIERGICPGQPFLVHVEEPTWRKTSWEYDEWDCDFEWEILERAPRDPAKAAKAWSRFFLRRAEDRRTIRRGLEDRKFLAETDVSAMYIRHDVYWHGPYGDGYPPDGIIVELASRHHGGHWLAQGRCHEARVDRTEKAWKELEVQVALRLPHLDPGILRSLPTR